MSRALREYHSAPRIFRYLTPISFFLSLHTAKLLLDGARGFSTAMPSLVAPLCAVGLLAGNLVGAVRAIAPRAARGHRSEPRGTGSARPGRSHDRTYRSHRSLDEDVRLVVGQTERRPEDHEIAVGPVDVTQPRLYGDDAVKASMCGSAGRHS